MDLSPFMVKIFYGSFMDLLIIIDYGFNLSWNKITVVIFNGSQFDVDCGSFMDHGLDG